METSLEESSDNEEEFYSSTESPSFHGDLGPPTLLAFQLVIACVALHQARSKAHPAAPGSSPSPLGLPHFPVKKRGRKSHLLQTEAINGGNQKRGYGASTQRSSSDGFTSLTQTKNAENLPARSQSSPVQASFVGTQEQPWNAPTLEKFVIKSSTSQTHVESFPLLRRRVTMADSLRDHSSHVSMPYDDDDVYVCSPSKVSMDKHLDRGSLRELSSKQWYVNRELDSANDREGSICTVDLSEDGESSLCVLGQRTCGSGEEDSINQWAGEITDSDLSMVRELPEHYPEESSISSDSFLESSLVVAHHEKQQPPFVDDEASKCEEIRSGKQEKVDEFLRNRNTNMVSGDASNFEGSHADRMPEGQLDSLLLWPVGLAVEAVAFQVRLVAQAFALIILLYNWCNSFTSNRVRETLQAKEKATEALNQKIAIITNVPPKVTESGSMVLKRAAWGCFAATYVCILLSMLLFPALFLDYVFLSKIVEEPVNVKEPLHFDYTLPHPAAVVFVHPLERSQNLVSKSGSHQEHARAIPIAHKVHITVILTLPESDYNRNLGMFQLSAELLSATGESIKSSSRPCMLWFHSVPIRMLRTFLVSLPSLVGAFTESQTLVVHLMQFEEQQVATDAVRILLQPKAGMPVGHGIPEIYSAEVHIESHLPWLKNVMRNWKWTVYIWTGLMLYVVEVIMVLCCCRQALLPKTWMRSNDEGNEQPQENMPAEAQGSASAQNQLLGRRRQHSRNEQIPTARPILNRREHKLRPKGSHSSM